MASVDFSFAREGNGSICIRVEDFVSPQNSTGGAHNERLPSIQSSVSVSGSQEKKITLFGKTRRQDVQLRAEDLVRGVAQSISDKFAEVLEQRYPNRHKEEAKPYTVTIQKMLQDALDALPHEEQDGAAAFRRGLDRVKKYCTNFFQGARNQEIVDEFLQQEGYSQINWEISEKGTCDRDCYFVHSTKDAAIWNGVKVFQEPVSREEIIAALGGNDVAAALGIRTIEKDHKIYGFTFTKDPEEIVKSGFSEGWWRYVARGQPQSLHNNLRQAIAAKNPQYPAIFQEYELQQEVYLKSLANCSTQRENDERIGHHTLPIEELERYALSGLNIQIKDVTSREDLIAYEEILQNPYHPIRFARAIGEKIKQYAETGSNEELKTSCRAIVATHESAQVLPNSIQEASVLHLAIVVALWGTRDVSHVPNEASFLDDNSGGILFWACTIGSLPLVEHLLKQEPDHITRNDDGYTALGDACATGNLPLVQCFLKHGFSLDTISDEGYTLLYVACKSGSLPLVCYLLQLGLDKTALDKEGKTVLHAACASGSLPLVKYLIEQQGLDKNALDREKQTILFAACKSGSLPLVRYLIEEEGLDPHTIDDEKSTILHAACESDSLPLVRYLIEECQVKKDTADGNDATILHTACEYGSVPLVRYLIEEQGLDKDDCDEDDQTILHYACEGGHLPVVRYLIEVQGFDPHVVDDEDNTILHCACEGGSAPLVEYLLEHCFNKNDCLGWKKTLSLTACKDSSLPVVRSLAKYGLFVSAHEGDDSVAVLHAACLEGDAPLVEHLVKQGFDIFAKDSKQNRALDVACAGHTLAIVQYLYQMERKQGGKPARDTSLLERVCDWAFKEEVAFRIEARGQGLFGQQAHIAQVVVDALGHLPSNSTGNDNIAKYLVEMGHDCQEKRGTTLTPLRAACRRGKASLVHFFIKKGLAISQLTQPPNPLLHELYRKSTVNDKPADPEGRRCLWNILGKLGRKELHLCDAEGETLLHIAARKGDLELIDWLTRKAHVSVKAKNNDGETAFQIACEAYIRLPENNERKEIVHYFLSKRPGPALDELSAVYGDRTLLHAAASRGDMALVRTLLKHTSIAVDSTMTGGFTPFGLALENNHRDIADLLAAHGAKLFAVTHSETTLHLALGKKDSELIRQIVASGVRWDIRDQNGDTPLHLIARELQYADFIEEALRQQDWKRVVTMPNNSGALALESIFENLGVEAAARIVRLLLQKLNFVVPYEVGPMGSRSELLEKLLPGKETRTALLELAMLLGDKVFASLQLEDVALGQYFEQVSGEYAASFIKVIPDASVRVVLKKPRKSEKKALLKTIENMPPNPPQVTEEKLKNLLTGENYLHPQEADFANPLVEFGEILDAEIRAKPSEDEKRQAAVQKAQEAIITFWQQLRDETVLGIEAKSITYEEMRVRFAWIVEALLDPNNPHFSDKIVRHNVLADLVTAGEKCGPRKYNALLDSYSALYTSIKDFPALVQGEKMQIFKHTMTSFVAQEETENVHHYIAIAKALAAEDARFTTPQALQLGDFKDIFADKDAEISPDAIIKQIMLEYTPTELLDRLCLRYSDEKMCRDLFDALQLDVILPKMATEKWGARWEQDRAQAAGFSDGHAFFLDWATKNLGKGWEEEVKSNPRFQADKLSPGMNPNVAFVREQFLKSEFEEYLSGLYSFKNNQPCVSRAAMREALCAIGALEKI